MTETAEKVQPDIEESFKPKTNLSVKTVREGAIIAGFLDSPAGQVFLSTVYELYAEYLAQMLNPETEAKDLDYIRLKIHALLDVSGSLGVKISSVQQLQAQRNLAKRHVNDELQRGEMPGF